MRVRGALRCVVVGMFALFVACGGDDDDDGTVDDGADGAQDDGDDGSDGVDTTLDQLTDEEAAALCADSTEALSPDVFIEFSCYLISIATNPDDADACETAFQDCVDTTTEPTAGGFVCWVDPAVVTVLPPCAGEITAGDLQACMVASVEQVLDLFDGITCDTALEDLPDDLSDYELPEECAALQDLCPELFGTGA